MKEDPREMTNRELMEEYKHGDAGARFSALTEMAKRIHRNIIAPDVVSIFSQYKLNGAGDMYY